MSRNALAFKEPDSPSAATKEDNRFAKAVARAIEGDIRETAHLLSDETRLRESEVAVLLSISPATLRNRRALGTPILPYEKLTIGTVRYRWGTVRQALEERTEQVPAA